MPFLSLELNQGSALRTSYAYVKKINLKDKIEILLNSEGKIRKYLNLQYKIEKRCTRSFIVQMPLVLNFGNPLISFSCMFSLPTLVQFYRIFIYFKLETNSVTNDNKKIQTVPVYHEERERE